MLVQAVEDRQSPSALDISPLNGIFSIETLQAASLDEKRSAWKFPRHACMPRSKYLAPGLRLPTAEEFVANCCSFDDVAEDDMTTPVCILRGDYERAASNPWKIQEKSTAFPWGLYLDMTELFGLYPFEDGCQLLLPYSIAGPIRRKLWNRRYIKHSCELLQILQNPFIVRHSLRLAMFLGFFAKAVVDGLWNVN